MAEEDLPYRAEYSKSGRASCRSCKGNIAKDSLRIAAMVQSPMFDGKVPNWYHYMCFFGKQRPSSTDDIANFDSLRFDDQKKIKEKLESAGAAPAPSAKGKGKKKGTATGASTNKEFSVEIAKSGRAGCKGCEQKLLKGEVRISKMDYTSDSARRYGPMPRWHHIECFLKLRDELQFFGAAVDLPGFYALPADTQEELKGTIKMIKRKAEDAVDSAVPLKKAKPNKEDEKLHKKQNDVMFSYRDQLKHLSKSELAQFIEYNIPSYESEGESNMLDRLSDYLAFGLPEDCSLCKIGTFVFKSGTGYKCNGHLTEFTRCTNIVKAPKRTHMKIPDELAESYPFLAKYKQPKLGDRYFVERVAPTPSTSSSNGEKPKLDPPKRPGKPLIGLQFLVHGKSFSNGQGKKEIGELVKNLGGTLTTKLVDTTAAIITSEEELVNGHACLDKAKTFGIQCVGEEFLEEVKAGDSGAMLMIKKKAISDWGEDPEQRVTKSKLYSSMHKSTQSRFTKSMPSTLKVQVKDGSAVDPDSGLGEVSHVLKHGGKLYNSVLGLVDIVRGTNSYYKLQLLEADSKNSWWVFRSWGRIGTTIGGNKLESMEDKQDGIRHFQSLYEEKTGNRFTSESFTKLPGKWQVLDIDYGEEAEIQKPLVSESKSKLSLGVKELVALIFDVDSMKSQMVEFEIDLKKLPLGKLSRKQLTAAYTVLTEAQNILNEDDKNNAPRILDCSNRFYTLIPHDFGMNSVPLLDNLELIKSKIEMVESLTEIEVAYSLLKDTGGTSADEDPIDKHYKKLNTKIEELARDTKEFEMLQNYVKNTHASTHAHYKLNIENIFKVEREGESKRFKPFKKLHNRKLLWHGSRLTNYAGILSQGLRIAPPEAPATGYMFGKGIYFADMVSKSANYCNTSSSNPTGLMLLCDVALGNMYERHGAEYVTKLASGKHSTKGCGRTYPDPQGTETLDGIDVPIGKPVQDSSIRSSLLYNEYIVYDVAQVNVKYLLKMGFNYSY